MSSLRKIATPVTIGSFFLMSVTGILLFFHLNTTFNKVAHEYLGLVMVAAVVLHVVLNWRAFALYFKRPLALGLMAVFVVALGLSFAPTPQGAGRPEFAVIAKVMEAPIEHVAPMLGTDTSGLIAQLAAQGIVASPGQSLTDLAGPERGAAPALFVKLAQ
ncbi:MAG: DUF4405 domain-containing protein [Thalassovita sp.]